MISMEHCSERLEVSTGALDKSGPAPGERGASFYPQRLRDAKATCLTPDDFPVCADGVADDAEALQQAINRAQAASGFGIVFVPEGRYRLGKTVHVWAGIRLVSPSPYGVKIASCHDLEFRGVHVYSPTKLSFDNTLHDVTSGAEVRSREIAKLIISGRPPEARLPKARSAHLSPVLAPGARVERVAGGFEFIDGVTADRAGNVYFVDGRWHRIYRWSPDSQTLTLVCDTPIGPLALAFDQAGHLLITARTDNFTCTVFALDPGGDASELQALPAVPASACECTVAILPGHRWRDAHDFLAAATRPSDAVFVSPDGTTFIPKSDDLRRAFLLRAAVPGLPFYLADEFGQKTWVFEVSADGTLSKPQLFAEKGELDVAVDAVGNVYVAAGEIFVYTPAGELIDTIAVPERPATLVFGGPEGKTLFITARSSLYSVGVRYPGRVQVPGRARARISSR
ncbi:MAG: SMP-30/gluconolactonase/LRE family protein [Anaerolineae bacterium]|nr:SMP-30/gluconolactonase/LRE family protein [Anaerolineae bacterium]